MRLGLFSFLEWSLSAFRFLDAFQELNSQKFSASGRRLKDLRFGLKDLRIRDHPPHPRGGMRKDP